MQQLDSLPIVDLLQLISQKATSLSTGSKHTFLCLICYEHVDLPKRMIPAYPDPTCQHIFCKACITSYIER